jgi:hypothetical protein
MKTSRGDGLADGRTWYGWSLFGPRDKEGKHACKLCQQRITYSNSTTSFKKHLTKRHPAEWDLVKARKGELEASQQLNAEIASPSTLSVAELLNPKAVEAQKAASKQLIKSMEADIVRFIIGDVRPFNAVEGTRFFLDVIAC